MDQLSRPAEHAIYSAIAAMVHKMRPQEVTNTIYSLGLMKFIWSDIRTNNNKTTEGLCGAVSALHRDTSFNRHQHIANVVYSLGNLEAMWTDLSADNLQLLIQNLHDNSNPQNLSSTLLGLSNMALSWDDFTRETRLALLKSARQCLIADTKQVRFFVSVPAVPSGMLFMLVLTKIVSTVPFEQFVFCPVLS